jgi:hypothetical protein
MEERPRTELARRLFAAATSAQLGYAGVDYLLKQHVREGRELGEYWYQLAAEVERTLTGAASLVFSIHGKGANAASN